MASIALQYGVPLDVLRHALMRDAREAQDRNGRARRRQRPRSNPRLLAEDEVMRRVSVSDGRRALGLVIERDDGFQAIDAEGRIVATYRSEPAAATELWRHDRRLPTTNEEGEHANPAAST
jgi:hypothetical protein